MRIVAVLACIHGRFLAVSFKRKGLPLRPLPKRRRRGRGNVGDALSASSKRRCEEWDRFTVPRFARARHFHDLGSGQEGELLRVKEGTRMR